MRACVCECVSERVGYGHAYVYVCPYKGQCRSQPEDSEKRGNLLPEVGVTNSGEEMQRGQLIREEIQRKVLNRPAVGRGMPVGEDIQRTSSAMKQRQRCAEKNTEIEKVVGEGNQT